jgi:hypothetical protein
MWNLDRDSAIVRGVGGAKNRSHSAACHKAFDPVVIEQVAGVEIHEMSDKVIGTIRG